MIPQLQPTPYASALINLQELAGALLRHLASSQTGRQLDEERLRADLPQVESLLGPLRRRINALLAGTDATQRAHLADAFDNDIGFDQRHDAPDFRFRYPGLPGTVRRVAKQLLAAFYDPVLYDGYSIIGPDGTELTLDRHLLEHGFFDANAGIRACPACLERRLEEMRSVSIIGCDHYLPKAIYAPLAVHPMNLYFTCMPCNERLKGQKDPLTGARSTRAIAERTQAGALCRSYLPFLRPAEEELELRFTRRSGARATLRLTAATPEAQVRVENLDRIFGLTEGWTAALPRTERELREKLEGSITPGSLKTALDMTIKSGRRPIVQLEDGVFVSSRYASYLRTTDLRALAEEWAERLEEGERSRRLHAA